MSTGQEHSTNDIESEWESHGYEIVNTGGACWAAIKVVEGVEFWVGDYHETRHPDPAGALIVSAYVPNSGQYLDFCRDVESLEQAETNLAGWAADLQDTLCAAITGSRSSSGPRL